MINEAYEWVWETDLSEFAGKWVVILDKRVVASGNKNEIGEKLAEIRKKYPSSHPLVMKVPLKSAMIL